MQAALTTKTEEKGKSRIVSTDLPKMDLTLESQSGAQAGLPLFLQTFPLLEGKHTQAKLSISRPSDPDEEEADLVADSVMRMRDPSVATPVTTSGERGAQFLARAGKTATGLQRKADVSGEQPRSSGGFNLITNRDNGQPLNASTRTFFEPRFGKDFSQVRVHTGENAAQAARAMQARAFTFGQDLIFGAGEYSPHSREGQKLLAHELAHTLQHSSTPGRVRRNVPPPATQATLESVGLPTSAESGRDERAMINYLGSQSHRMLAVDEQLTNARPRTAEEREELEETLIRAVRLKALGLMAAHRVSIEEARDRVEGRNRFPAEGDQPAQSTRSVLVEMREAAQIVSNLQAIEGRLQNYRDQLHDANRDARHHSGSVGDTLHLISANGSEFMDENLRTGLREGWHAGHESSSYWLWAIGASGALIQLRDQQIAGIRLAISEVYTRFPQFAELAPSEVGSSALASDQALLEASRRAYQRVLTKVDDAISNIATGDIHPFDLPNAVEATRTGKPPSVQQALNEAIQRHERIRFWLNLGLTTAEIILCFMPVVGQALALGLGAVMIGMTVEDMMDRLTVGRASTDPYNNPVGINDPSGFEWVMAGVAGILMLFGGAGIARSAMRGFRAFQTLGRLAPELSAGSRMRLARVMTRQPELIAAPRTSGALEAELRAAGVEASATEIQALRATSYERAGLPLPRSSSESLDSFLDDIWNDRQSIIQQAQHSRQELEAATDLGESASTRQLPEASDAVYDIPPRQPNPLTSTSERQYLERLEQLRSGRPEGAVSSPQNPSNPSGTWHQFRRAGVSDSALRARARERIYLSIDADHATEVMEHVVRNILDDESVPGVLMAKVIGPRGVAGRADTILIAVEDAAAAEGVLARLRSYQQAGRPGFRAGGGPPIAEEAMPGVSVGQEPTAEHLGQSFGRVRARAITQGLEETVAAGGNREQFIARVRDLLRTSGINPDAPHLNLPAPAAALPPGQSGPSGPPGPAGPAGGVPVMPAILAGQADRDRER